MAGGKAELAAQFAGAFRQPHFMAALGGDPCGFETGGAATDHQHFARGVGARHTIAVPLVLARHGRVDQAGNVIVAHPSPKAELVAGDARADIVDPAFARLVGKMRIGDLASDQRHQVGITGADHLVGVGRRLDARFGSDFGVLDDLLVFRCIGRPQHHAVVKARHDQAELVEVASGAGGEIVDQGALVEPGDDLLLVGGGQAAGVRFGAGNRHTDDEIVAVHLADAVADAGGEAHAVFETAAPLIVTPVGQRRPELIDQAVVAGKDVGAVEA